MKVYHLKKQISDVLKDEYNFQFCREAMSVSASGAEVEVKVGELYQQSTATKYQPAGDAVPAIFTVTLAKSGASTANNTLIVGGVTFTAKASPSVTPGTTEYALDATASEIAAIVAAKGLANYTVMASGDQLIYEQTTAGTGSAIAVGSGTDATVTGTVAETQAYAQATTGNLSDMDCICLENRVIADGETATVLVLVRGPAMYDVDNLEISEGDKESVKAHLKTLWMIATSQPPVTATQTT
ncbi:MAG: hypothetical protein Q4D98_14350 [Planctomycetia bacterium]|nr:hypothetical protein [Planctomycetia bacterium]